MSIVPLDRHHLSQGMFCPPGLQVLGVGHDPLWGGVWVLHPHQLPSLEGHWAITSSVSLLIVVMVTSRRIWLRTRPTPYTMPEVRLPLHNTV